MKKIQIVFATVLTILVSGQLMAQTVDEVIAKHINAMGGTERLLALKTSVSEASLDVQGMAIPVKMTQVHNVGQRIDINAMGMENFIIQTPTEGWTFMPIQGQASPEPTAPELVKETSDALDLQGALLNYKEKGHTVELVGKEDFDGVECFKLKVSMKNGMQQTLLIDPSNYYIIKAITKSKAGGKEVEQEQTFSNFVKNDAGYVFPYSMTGFGPGELKISKIELNVPVDEKIFKLAK